MSHTCQMPKAACMASGSRRPLQRRARRRRLWRSQFKLSLLCTYVARSGDTRTGDTPTTCVHASGWRARARAFPGRRHAAPRARGGRATVCEGEQPEGGTQRKLIKTAIAARLSLSRRTSTAMTRWPSSVFNWGPPAARRPRAAAFSAAAAFFARRAASCASSSALKSVDARQN